MLTDFFAAAFAAAVAIFLTLAGPCLGKISEYCLRPIYTKLYRGEKTHSDPERQRLLNNGLQPNNVPSITSESVPESSAGSIFWWLLRFVSYLVVVAYALAGVFSAEVENDRVALWASEHCGTWKFDSSKAGEGAATRADVYDRLKESRAGEYARNCYETSSMLESMYCNVFYMPTINFTTSYSFQCPFQEIDRRTCSVGSPSVTFDTGLVNADQIGINVRHPHKFRRWTTCSSLSVEYPYVRSEVENGTNVFNYYYGRIINGNRSTEYTHTSRGNPFEWPAPVYEAR